MQVFSVQMTHGADSNTWTKHDLSDVSLILPFQFPSQCCVCYVMSHPTLAWPHRRWVMSESALSWLHRKAFVRFLFHWTIFRMRQEALSLSDLRGNGRSHVSLQLPPLKYSVHNRKMSKDNQECALLSCQPSVFSGCFLFFRVVDIFFFVFQTGMQIFNWCPFVF